MDDEFGDGRLTFYYSREERLKKAPKAVQDLNNHTLVKKQGFFRTFTSTRPLTFLFISVIALSGGIIILSRYLSAEGTRMLGNNTVFVSVLTAGDNSYITVKKTAGSGSAYTGAVDIAVSPSGTEDSEETPVHTERIYFGMEQEEVFRFSVPFRGKKLLILMEAGADRVVFTVTPE
jgi:hypothetical protein